MCKQIIDIIFQNLTKQKNTVCKGAAKSCNVRTYGVCRVNSVVCSSENHSMHREKLKSSILVGHNEEL